MVITSETEVRQIAVEAPASIPLLEHFGLDYCCGGQHTLAQACASKNVQLAPVLEALQDAPSNPNAATDWQTAPLHLLAEHIVTRHHGFTRQQLTLLCALMEKVQSRHGDTHAEVPELGKALAALAAELTHHFVCEENILFPYIARLEQDGKAALPPMFGSISQPIQKMMLDHDRAGDELSHMRTLTNNYQPPQDACTTYRALYRALEELEKDLHQHIHLENNILFPRALELSKVR
jgi:regulator of cell morphogenesis and NO signaling